jgi:hypothetical protein
MKKHPFTIKVLLLIIVVFALSCNINDLDFDDIKTPNYKGEVAVPIGEVSYTMKELLEEVQDSAISIEEGGNSFITVVYRDTSLFNDATEFVNIGQIENSANLNPNISTPASPVDLMVPFSESFEFDFQASEGEQIDSLTYKSGTISLRVSSSFNSNMSYTMKIVDFRHSETGDTLTFTGNNSTLTTLDLAKYTTSFNSVGGVNQFSLLFDGLLDVKAGEVVNPTDFLSFTLTIDNPTFSSLFGFFGSTVTNIQDQSIALDFFEDITPGGFEFNSPEISLILNNAFGIPLGISFKGLTSSNSAGDMANLTGTVTETLQSVRAPAITAVGTSIGSVLSINSSNSNLRDLLNIAPDTITLAITGTSNFGNETGIETNFLTDSSFLQTIVEVRMPLDLRLNNFTRDFDFDISSSTFDEADSIKLRIQTLNELPITGSFVAYFLNDASDTIYQIPQTIVLSSPEVNNIDKTVEAFHNTAIITLDPTGIQAFSNAAKINLTLTADSYKSEDGTFVKIFSDYKLLIKLSAIANLNVEI